MFKVMLLQEGREKRPDRRQPRDHHREGNSREHARRAKPGSAVYRVLRGPVCVTTDKVNH